MAKKILKGIKQETGNFTAETGYLYLVNEGGGYVQLDGKTYGKDRESIENKVTAITEDSTHEQYASAKVVWGVSADAKNALMNSSTAAEMASQAQIAAQNAERSASSNPFTKGTGENSAKLKNTSAVASGSPSISIGNGTTASAGGSAAFGYNSQATNSNAFANGNSTIANGNAAHAEGINTRAGAGSKQTASTNTTEGFFSHAEGNGTLASGNAAHAEGGGSEATGRSSHAEGQGTKSNGYGSHSEGYSTVASANQSHAEGGRSVANAQAAHAEGYATSATSISSHSEGRETNASGEASHAEGSGTTASGNISHAEGANTKASGQCSHAEGCSTSALTDYSHAEGEYTTASSEASHAEGSLTAAKGNNSHAEGYNTTASGYSSHAEGYHTIANGHSSHAEGYHTIANGHSSHAEGQNTNTTNKAEHAEGEYNVSNSGYTISSIGIGTSATSKNAIEVLKNGEVFIIGIGGYDGTNIFSALSVQTVIRKLKLKIDPPDAAGHEYVDLELPSGTLWAKCNVGASAPEEYGGYYAWGETETKSGYTWENYKFGNGTSTPGATGMTKYNATDGKAILDLEDDAAHVNWGGDWKMPTSAQCQELIDDTMSEWTSVNGVNGRRFTSKTNGNSIFIPAAGYRRDSSVSSVGVSCHLRSSSLPSVGADATAAWRLICNEDGVYGGGYYRYTGFSVRGVLY